mmetsp:Transcript_111331/g.314278  ORF Transcript_111331/g.314278 Transcript_111331/m.314278 type:complete len:285 (+) Transcript_111331:275-1129(+)
MPQITFSSFLSSWSAMQLMSSSSSLVACSHLPALLKRHDARAEFMNCRMVLTVNGPRQTTPRTVDAYGCTRARASRRVKMYAAKTQAQKQESAGFPLRFSLLRAQSSASMRVEAREKNCTSLRKHRMTRKYKMAANRAHTVEMRIGCLNNIGRRTPGISTPATTSHTPRLLYPHCGECGGWWTKQRKARSTTSQHMSASVALIMKIDVTAPKAPKRLTTAIALERKPTWTAHRNASRAQTAPQARRALWRYGGKTPGMGFALQRRQGWASTTCAVCASPCARKS